MKTDIPIPAPAAAYYLDKNALARAFCVSPRTVCRWIDAGVPALDLAAATGSKHRILRFSVPEVRAWLDDCAARKSLKLPASAEQCEAVN